MRRSKKRSAGRSLSRQTRSQSESKANLAREKSIGGLACALLVVAILSAYVNHFHNSFHFDDGHAIINNASIRALRNIPLFFRDATTFSALPSNQSYRPLVSTLIAVDYQLAHGLQPFWFHVSIFGLFIALTLLLASVIHHLLESDPGRSPDRWIALATAAWWALHPVNADTINYIIASSGEVISALGVIASFAVYLAFPRLRRYYLFVLPAAIAVLAKPTAAIYAVLFAVFHWLFPDLAVSRRRSRMQSRLVEMVIPFVVCGALLLFVQHMTPRSWTAGATNPLNYLVTEPYVALLYFKRFFWPTGLSADYDLKPFVTMSDPRVWIGFAFVISISTAAILAALSRKTRVISFGLLWFLIALLPTSLFPLAEVMNCYRTFLPYVGLVIAMAGAAKLLVARLDRQRSWTNIAATCAVALLLCANAYATFQRNKVWKTEETLWHDVVLKSPRNERGLMGYGIQLMAKNDVTDALDYFRRAQQLTPHYPELLINIAIAEDATKQTVPAEEHFKEALELAPSSPDSYIYYARYLLSHSRGDEARALLERALELTPNDVTARELLKQTDLASPFQDHGAVHIGRNEETNRDGDPKAFVRKKFMCGSERDKWCTVHFVVSFYKGDNERLKITLSGEGDNKKTVLLTKETTANPNIPNSRQFAVSVKGCGECEVRIEITEGDIKNVQSRASISLSNRTGPTCTDSDITGGEGPIGLVNEHDEDILRPTATPTSGE